LIIELLAARTFPKTIKNPLWHDFLTIIRFAGDLVSVDEYNKYLLGYLTLLLFAFP